jgi:hypothetical protein
MTLLPTFGDSLTVLPIGVSDQGDVVGNSLTFLGWPEHVMYWRQGVGLIDLSTAIGSATHARGITPSGAVVFGGIDDVLSTSSYGGYTQRPCLWILRRQ